MQYQLKWNADTESGFVMNDIYRKGYVFEDLSLKPILSGFEYESLVYDTATSTFTLTVNSITLNMTNDQKVAALNACSGWLDTTYVFSTEEFEIHKQNKLITELAYFNTKVDAIAPFTPSHEMTSWRKQEEQAKAWFDNNLVDTPIIDSIMVTRGGVETKSEFVDLILTKAALYESAYGALLGKWQKLYKQIILATTKEELNAIVWS